MGKSLQLHGLTTLPADAIRALAAASTWDRLLPRLANLDVDAARAVVAIPNWNGSLPGLTGFESPDAVAVCNALATRKGPLALPNLRKISPRALSALLAKEDVEIPPIETLHLIPEPDGSPSDDFVVPKAYEKRQQEQRLQSHDGRLPDR